MKTTSRYYIQGICFCSFDLSCPLLIKDNFIENMYIVLSSFLTLFVSYILHVHTGYPLQGKFYTSLECIH